MPAESENVSQRPTIEELRQQRGSSKGSLTRIKNSIESNRHLSQVELECRLGVVENYYKQACHYQTEIEKQNSNDSGRAELDELFILTKSLILTKLGQSRPLNSTLDQSLCLPSTTNSRLPKLQLPKFDGQYMEYQNFIYSFKSLVHNDNNIPVIEKFNHLLSCLKGEAFSTVKCFQVIEAKYSLALERLE